MILWRSARSFSLLSSIRLVCSLVLVVEWRKKLQVCVTGVWFSKSVGSGKGALIVWSRLVLKVAKAACKLENETSHGRCWLQCHSHVSMLRFDGNLIARLELNVRRPGAKMRKRNERETFHSPATNLQTNDNAKLKSAQH